MTSSEKSKNILRRHAQIAKAPYRDMLSFFDYRHLPEVLQGVSKPFHNLAHSLVDELPNHSQKMVALQKLLEAKDAAVRIAVASTHSQRDKMKLMIAEGYESGENASKILESLKEKFPESKISLATVQEYIDILQNTPAED